MDYLQPRRAYHRANSNEPGAYQDGFEMGSIYSNNSGLEYTKSNEYSSNYHIRPGGDEIPLLKSAEKKSRLSGWRAGAVSASGIAFISLLINLAAAVYLIRHPNRASSLVQVYSGDCGQVSNMDTWVHLAINTVSTLLLGGSNYCMQCLTAPTRKEIDKHHVQGRYLDIGVPSYRNLFKVAGRKQVLWWLLALSSLPLHLMYNSAFYLSLATNDYWIYVVAPDFLTGTNSTVALEYNPSPAVFVSPPTLQAKYMANHSSFERLTPENCINKYATVFTEDRRNLVIVSTNSSQTASSTLRSDNYVWSEAINLVDQIYYPFDWICTCDKHLYERINTPASINNQNPSCERYYNQVANIANEYWQPYGYNIDYCLSESIDQECSFNGNIPIILTIVICNAIKIVLMLVVAFRLQDNPLITVGDAIESFLDNPDPTTRGMCLMNLQTAQEAERVNQGVRAPGWQIWLSLPIDRTFFLGTKHWSAAASHKRWTFTISLLVLALVVVGAFLGLAINAISPTGITIANLGFGKVHAQAIITGWGIQNITPATRQVLACILIANLPQLVLSFVYLNLNGLLTSMFVALEWSKFAIERKTLRVSTPKGEQRSRHFLQLPYKIAIPLMGISILLHWLVSQSIFLAVLAEYAADGSLYNPVAIASCGFSPLAMIAVIVLGILMIIGIWLIGKQKYDSQMPLVGSCSAAISAACHPPAWDVDVGVKAVKWGVIPGSGFDGKPPHCCFSSGEVLAVQAGWHYT